MHQNDSLADGWPCHHQLGQLLQRRQCGAGPPAIRMSLAVGKTVILLQPPLHLVGLSIVMERGCQQIDSLADGYTSWCLRADDDKGREVLVGGDAVGQTVRGDGLQIVQPAVVRPTAGQRAAGVPGGHACHSGKAAALLIHVGMSNANGCDGSGQVG